MSSWNFNKFLPADASKWRRNSSVKIMNRLRSGSLPGWVGNGGRPVSIPLGSGSKPKQNLESSSSRKQDRNVMSVLVEKSLNGVPSPGNAHDSGIEVADYPNSPLHRDVEQPFLENSFSKSSLGDKSPLSTPQNKFTIVPMKRCTPVDVKLVKQQQNEVLGLIISALYGKLLVVMGIAFPMSEVISSYIPPSFYDGFYLYLYFGSIIFMLCVYVNMVRRRATNSVRTTWNRITTMGNRLTATASNLRSPSANTTNIADKNTDRVSSDSEGTCSDSVPSPNRNRREKIDSLNDIGLGSSSDHEYAHRVNFGSFYLRMGAVAFGIGSMIYSGLEFGQYFELEPDTKCHNYMIALTPSVRMIFTFMQMYFIFLNAKMTITENVFGSKFGLMHMIGTNLCVWLSVLVQETRHEILHFYNPDNGTITYPKTYPVSLTSVVSPMASHSRTDSWLQDGIGTTEIPFTMEGPHHHRRKRGLKGPYSIYECRRSDIMGSLVQNASPFLFPCTIEYSLICAASLYVMWKSMAKRRMQRVDSSQDGHHVESHVYPGPKRSPHHYSVDCARANKGLFLGILVLVITIISLILFFVLITRPGYQALATLEVNVTELFVYTTTTIAVLIGMCQMRELRHCYGRNLELDNILLIVAQTGSFIYNMFTLIGGYFTMKKYTPLVLMTALASLIQLMTQTLFILDSSRRQASTAEQARKKPGREVVTFLLVTNLAMWAINTLEKSRADSHPVQLKFYGVWAWTIITHISMPLAIFYRFHSTVCLCEIWKRAYKLKGTHCR